MYLNSYITEDYNNHKWALFLVIRYNFI